MRKLYISTLLIVMSLSIRAQVTVNPVIGPQELAILPFDYALDGTEISLAELDSGFFTAPSSVKAFFEEASYGKMTITGIVYPYRTNQPPLYGTGYTNCYPEDDVMVNQPDVDYSIIDGIVLFPHDTSSTASCAAGLSSSEKLPFTTADGFLEFRRSGFRTEFYFPSDFSQTTSSTIAHELMHSFGNDFHSNSYIQENGEWVLQGYGNVFDILGLRSQASHPCSMIKHKLGWLTDQEIAIAQQTDTFRIHALEQTLPEHLQAVIVELPNSVDLQPNDAFEFDRLYLEYRGLTGFDYRPSTLRRVPLTNNTFYENSDIHGLSVIGVDCTFDEDCLPMLIDMHPEPIGGVGASYFPHEASDAPLLLGESYQVPNNDITLEVIYVDEGNYIDVVVSFPPTTNTNNLDNQNEIKVYPTPAQNYLNISNPGGQTIDIRLYDLFGKLVLIDQNTQFLDISSVANGTYLLKITGPNQAHPFTQIIIVAKP